MRMASMAVTGGAVVLAAVLAAARPLPASAQAVRVIVDGSPVAFDQPPIVTGGRVLVPLRGVFEQLGAFVQWNPANGTILATRADSEVRLTLGSRIAFVNGSQVRLDVPALVVAGRTLVPLRFVGEAMGAYVQWDAAGRTVYVASAAGQPVPPRVIPPAPAPRTSLVQGEVVRIDTAASRLYVQQGDQVYTVIVTADTAITGPSGSISLSRLRVGDDVTVTLNPQGHAIAIRSATARPPSGDVRITSVTHNARSTLRAGDTLTVRMRGTPGGEAVFAIEGLTGAIAMTERQRGVYVGRYTILSPLQAQNARVLVTLNVNGRITTAVAPTPITVSGSAAPALAILSPVPGAEVGNPVVVRGVATPGARVTVRVDYRGTVLLFPVSGTYGEATTTADASGNWQVTIRPSVRVPDAALTITARAEDPLGREAAPITVQATQG